jgi:ribokinase
MTADVVVLGSLHLDVVVNAPRLPRLGETLPGTGMALICGGKGGNQAVAAARHGARVAMIGCVGRDAFGARLRTNLHDAGIDVRHVREADAGSGTSVAIVDPGGDYGAVIVSAANLDLGAADVAAADALIGGARVLLLQNEVPEAANRLAARRAAASGVLVVLNAAPARMVPDELAGAVDLLVVNAVEAEMLGGGAVATLGDAARVARALADRAKAAIVTAGGAGVAVQAGREGFTMAAHPVSVAGTHGAGDAFAGALAARLARGDALAQAARYANAAAALAVATPAAERMRLSPNDVLRLLGMAP